MASPVSDSAVPVVVAGAEHQTGLGVARALRAEGVPIFGLAADLATPSCTSRLWSEVLPARDESDQLGWKRCSRWAREVGWSSSRSGTPS